MPINDEIVFERIPTPIGLLLDDLLGTITKHLAGRHDQSTHGGWADPSIRRMNAGNGLSARQIFDNTKNAADSQQRKLYDAENKCSPEIVRVLPKPVFPTREQFPDYANYSAAWDKTKKEYDEWAQESKRYLVSELANKHLDGTNKGVQNYFEEVTNSDWFKEEFGEEKPFGKIKFSLTDANYAGQYSYGFKGASPVATFKINRGNARNETTIVHEIAHMATTLKETGSHEAHGAEFARDYIFITRQVMGDQEADRLQSEFEKGGVKIAD